MANSEDQMDKHLQSAIFGALYYIRMNNTVTLARFTNESMWALLSPKHSCVTTQPN